MLPNEWEISMGKSQRKVQGFWSKAKTNLTTATTKIIHLKNGFW